MPHASTSTFSFYVKVILGLGLVFQMPMLVFFLARFGIVTAGFMIRKFKYAVLIIVVVAAVITPSGDPVDAGGVRRADARALRGQHRRRVGVRQEDDERRRTEHD